MLQHIHIIFNIPEYGSTPLMLILENLAIIHETYNGQYFLDLIWNSMWLQQHICKMISIFKNTILILNYYKVVPYIIAFEDV